MVALMRAIISNSLAVAGGAAGANKLAGKIAPAEFNMPMPPSVNDLYRNVKGRGRVKTSAYYDYTALGIAAIKRQKVAPVPGRVVVIAGFERKSMAADVDNRAKALFDVIVKAGVIRDDKFITATALVWLPMASGKAWVCIMPAEPFALQFQPSPGGATGSWLLPAATLENGELEHG
jgi:Holliday junction resolvase RusA-like endonuclease